VLLLLEEPPDAALLIKTTLASIDCHAPLVALIR
jgi:hypothetical protein